MTEAKGQVFIASEEKAKEEVKEAPKKTEQAVDFLDETQQRAVAAYTAYIEAQRQLEEAYKGQERQAEKAYNETVERAKNACEETLSQCRKVYEGNVSQALRTRDEVERKAREARNEAMERTWAVFTKARK